MPTAPRQHRILGIFLIVFAACVYAAAQQLPSVTTNLPVVDSGFFPTALSWLLGILGAWIFFEKGPQPGASSTDSLRRALPRVCLTLGLLAVYVAAIPKIGFEIATGLFLAVSMWLLGMRRPGWLVALPVLMPLAIYGLFVKLMYVPLPSLIQGL